MSAKDASEDLPLGQQEECQHARGAILRLRNEARTSEGAYVLGVE